MVGEDSAFGTLASTDSYSQDEKSETLKSRHLTVFTLPQEQVMIKFLLWMDGKNAIKNPF